MFIQLSSVLLDLLSSCCILGHLLHFTRFSSGPVRMNLPLVDIVEPSAFN